ncbi:hypothetical protein JB92DRAFT_2940947 [Gautieria morchelliformis]|nr:hypothetical protein JB92DRAFT_2940947 [Gautieria morchelliformis]
MAPPPAAPPVKLIFTTTSLRNVTIATASDSHYYEVVTHKWEPEASASTHVRRLQGESGIMLPVAELRRGKEREGHEDGVCTGVVFVRSPGGEERGSGGAEGANPENGKRDQVDQEDVIAPDVFLAGGDDGKSLGTFTVPTGQHYTWRESKRSIELINPASPDKPLARFHRHHRHLGVLRMSAKPSLDVAVEIAEDSAAMDHFIVSFLLAEARRRR